MFALNTLDLTPEFLRLISEIDEFKGAWKALGTLAPERLSSLRQVAHIASVGSSTRIEGSRLSDADVEKLLANLSIRSFATRDEQEVVGYAQTLEQLCLFWEQIPLTENYIRQLHRDLLRHSEKDTWHCGNYKSSPNHVVAFDENGQPLGIVFETATPFETPQRMRELLEWTNASLETQSLHPLLVIGIFTVVFLAIHPFQDGNGRLSRLLSTLLLLRCGYAYVPYSSLENVIENNKEGYYVALRQTQESLNGPTPHWQPWLRFFLRALHQQMKHLEKKMEIEHRLLAEMPELSVRIVEHIRKHGRATPKEMAVLTGVSRNTLKEHFRRLVESGQLARQGKGRGVWYILR